MTTAAQTVSTAASAIIAITCNGIREEVNDIDAFRAEHEDADKIFEDLLMDASCIRGNATYTLLDAQALIQRMQG